MRAQTVFDATNVFSLAPRRRSASSRLWIYPMPVAVGKLAEASVGQGLGISLRLLGAQDGDLMAQSVVLCHDLRLLAQLFSEGRDLFCHLVAEDQPVGHLVLEVLQGLAVLLLLVCESIPLLQKLPQHRILESQGLLVFVRSPQNFESLGRLCREVVHRNVDERPDGPAAKSIDRGAELGEHLNNL
eukprot:scaffold7734_cov296-Pinguiococcus_pyrenoidosus.AAC.2